VYDSHFDIMIPNVQLSVAHQRASQASSAKQADKHGREQLIHHPTVPSSVYRTAGQSVDARFLE
jgi:polysaccharide deacetylase 2 family uncharacterized protein YibQ